MIGDFLDPRQKYIYISSTVNKARNALGFIERRLKKFDDPYISKTLFISLVRPVLDRYIVYLTMTCLNLLEYYELTIIDFILLLQNRTLFLS